MHDMGASIGYRSHMLKYVTIGDQTIGTASRTRHTELDSADDENKPLRAQKDQD